MRVSNFELDGVPPFSFELTVHNPAGWFWHNPREVYADGKVWAACHLSSGKLVGLRAESFGRVDMPRVGVNFFSRQRLSNDDEKEIIDLVVSGLALDEDVSEFYRAFHDDSVLRHVIPSLHGMRRSTGLSRTVFASAVLALTLQNAPIRRTNQMLDLIIGNYGERVAFDGKTAFTWPQPQAITKATAGELARRCKVGYRAKYLRVVAKAIFEDRVPFLSELRRMPFELAKAEVMKLKGIGEYSAEIVLPHGETFPVDVWSAQIFWKLFFPGEAAPSSRLEAIRVVRKTAEERWGRWRKLAFVYVLCSLTGLAGRFGLQL